MQKASPLTWRANTSYVADLLISQAATLPAADTDKAVPGCHTSSECTVKAVPFGVLT